MTTTTREPGARLVRVAGLWVWATPNGMLEYNGRHSWPREQDAEQAAGGSSPAASAWTETATWPPPSR